MSTYDLENKITKMQEYEALAVEAQAEADALRDEIKAELTRRNAEEVTTEKYIVRWTSVLSQRFDSTAFKRAMPDIYKAFTKQVSSRRFSVSA